MIAVAGDNLGDFADVFNYSDLGVQARRELAARGEFALAWQPLADAADAGRVTGFEVLLQLQRERKQAGVQPDANMWGSTHPATSFNPHAFDSAAYF